MNIDHQISNIESNLSDQSSDKWEILFLDTFTSSSSSSITDIDYLNEDANKKEPNIGLVQFSCPVVIHEVKIIPLSTVVTAESLRTVRLGATIPSSFDIHFYVNDLKAKDSSTFLDIGSFSFKEYENNIFKPSVLVATDGLFLRGHFESVTLAVLGEVTDLSSLLNNKESTSSKLSNETNDVKDIDDDEDSSSNINYESVDIKEPDDTQDLIHQQRQSSVHNDDDVIVEGSESEQHLVQDVHSLSPTSSRILSPTAQSNYSRQSSTTPKSHSNSSSLRENQIIKSHNNKKLLKNDYEYENDSLNDRKYNSRSRSGSISSPNNNYQLKSRVRYPTSIHRTSVERTRGDYDDDELISSSSHSRHHNYNHNRGNSGDRYDYDDRSSKYYSQPQHYRSRKSSRERSIDLSSKSSRGAKDHYRSSDKYSNSNDYRSRSQSKDSDDLLLKSSSRHRHYQQRGSGSSTKRSIIGSVENHDNRNNSRDCSRDNDNRSVSNLRTRISSGGGYNYVDYSDNNNRDLLSSPKTSKYHHRVSRHSSGSGRRSRSLSPAATTNRKRDYHRHHYDVDHEDIEILDRNYSSYKSSRHNRRNSRSSSPDDSIIVLNDDIGGGSPEIKKARYHRHSNTISSPTNSANSSISRIHHHQFNNNSNDDKKDASSTSKEFIENIASPVSNDDDDDDVVISDNPLSPLLQQSSTTIGNDLNMSPHSSISNVSLDSILDCDSTAITTSPKNSTSEGKKPTIKEEIGDPNLLSLQEGDGSKNEEGCSIAKDATEFFEPLSPVDNEDLLENDDGDNNDDNDGDNKSDDDNFEQISTSSDVDIIEINDDNEQLSNSNSNNIENNKETNPKAELELISSDEEYADEFNAALASDKVEYAKNYLDTATAAGSVGGKFDDDEIESAFDLRKNLFNPFQPDQLSPLKFPFNSNKTTTFVDLKLFNSIIKFVHEHFDHLYSKDKIEERKQLIQEEWVENVEKLANNIMLLTCPIYYSFNEESNKNIFDSREEIENLIPKLILIVKDGLDYDLALEQKNTPFKVRHLKAGIKLLIALFSSFEIRFRNENQEDNGDRIFQNLLDHDLPYELLKLYNMPFMSISLRLLILNGLMVICDHPEGVEYLILKKFDWSCTIIPKSNDNDSDKMPSFHTDPIFLSEESLKNSTCYHYILSLCLTRQNTRLTSVFEELLEKIHLYELFQTLCNDSIRNSNQENDYHFDNGDESKTSNLYGILSQMIVSFDRLSNRIHRPLRLFPNNIYQYEIKTTVHTSMPLLLLATNETLLENVPNQNQFEYIHERFHCKHTSCSSSKIGFFSQKAFYRFFKYFNVLQLLIDLLTAESTADTSSSQENQHSPWQNRNYICERIIKLLDSIVSHQQGLKFLLEDQENVDKVHRIHSILVNFSTENTTNDKIQIDFANKVVNFGVKFITRLYTFKLIDNILYNIYEYQRENIKKKTIQNNSSAETLIVPSRNTTVIDSLLGLFMMIHFEKAIFRDMVIEIITMEHNFDAIYSFIVPITSQFDTSRQNFINNEKISSLDSTSFVYAAKISMACIQYMPEKNLLHFYEIYGKSLLKNTENVQTFVQNSMVKLHRSDIFQSHILKYSALIEWISPLKNDNFNSHDELIIRKFVTILKKHHDTFQNIFNTIENHVDRVFFIEPELITAIKILVSLCDPLANYGKNQDPDIQLKYKYSLICCYHFDCISYLLTILEAIVETCERPSHLTFPFTFNDSYLNLFVKNLKSNSPINTDNSNTANIPTTPKAHSLQKLNNSILHQGTLIIEFLRPSVRFLNLILNYVATSIGNIFNDSTPIPILLKLYNMLNHFHSSSNSELYPNIELSVKSYAKLIQQQIIDIILSVYTAIYGDASLINTEESWRKSIWTKMLKHLFEFTQKSPKYFVSGLEILSKILPCSLPLLVNKPLVGSETLFIINYRKAWSAHLHCVNDELENMITCLVLCKSIKVQTLLRVVCHKMCDLHSATVLTISKTITEFLVHNLVNIMECKWNSNEQQKQQQNNGSNSEKQSSPSSMDPKYYCNDSTKIIDFILDLFSSSLSFRIGILNAFYCFATSDTTHKEWKIYKFFLKMFEHLNRNKLNQNFTFLSKDFLTEIFHENETKSNVDNSLPLLDQFEQYFDVQDIDLISTLKTFKFSDKLTSKFFVACSQSLNQYFTDRKIFIDKREMENINNPNLEKEIINSPTVNTMDSPQQQDNIALIYSTQFIKLSHKSKMPDKWNSLNNKQDLNIEYDSIKMDLIRFAQKYLKIDADSLLKTLTNYYSPIVEPPETPEKPTEDTTKIKNMNLPPKRTPMRGRGRLYGHPRDPFRSRPPNTSRPPSMHVDDFVALEQRSDPLAGLVNKNRSNHLMHVVNTNPMMMMMPGHSTSNNSNIGSISSYVGKHSDYIRKKNYTTHHSIHQSPQQHLSSGSMSNLSSSYHSNYSSNPSTIKSSSSSQMMNNQNK